MSNDWIKTFRQNERGTTCMYWSGSWMNKSSFSLFLSLFLFQGKRFLPLSGVTSVSLSAHNILVQYTDLYIIYTYCIYWPLYNIYILYIYWPLYNIYILYIYFILSDVLWTVLYSVQCANTVNENSYIKYGIRLAVIF